MTHIHVTRPLATCLAHLGEDGEVRISACDPSIMESVELSLTAERASILAAELIDAVRATLGGDDAYERIDGATVSQPLPDGVDGHSLGRAS